MKDTSHKSKIVFVSTYPPSTCGIARFTKDLISGIKKQMTHHIEMEVCALKKGSQNFKYPREVKYILDTTNSNDYQDIAIKINDDSQVKAVMIEHEFGLFGGTCGNDIFNMLNLLNKPIIITFHTVIPKPDPERFHTVKILSQRAKKILVMTQTSLKILVRDYHIPEEKIAFLPHGTHLVLWKSKQKAKEDFGINKRQILTTFGLLGRGKSIETALDALSEIKKHFPNVLYYILGKTHPDLVKQEGEAYRQFLKGKVDKLGLKDNVKFVNHFLPTKELLNYLSITDVYLFTSKDPNQAVSGTFAYAMSSACPIIATPIPHAKELLTKDTGVLVDFENPQQMAKATIRLLKNRHLREQMGRNAFHKTRFTVWENVANGTIELFIPYIDNVKYKIPPINLKHLEHLTTRKGIIQFSDIDIADLSSGYTLDDNARALIALTRHYELTGQKSDLNLIRIYLDFIINCQKQDGSFINYIDYDENISTRNYTENLDDANGRAIWALGYFLSKIVFDNHLVYKAEICMIKALRYIKNIESPRALAFVIKGLHFYGSNKNSEKIFILARIFADRLLDLYNYNKEDDWHWYEPYLTYSNAVLPEAMLLAWKITGKISYRVVARESLNFLLANTFNEQQIMVITNNGWLKKGEAQSNDFGEQPIDVASTIIALYTFYSELNEREYINKIKSAFNWFLGANRRNQIIYNPITGGCYDGLEKEGANLNQGAESTIAYLLARLTIEKLRKIRIQKAMHSAALHSFSRNISTIKTKTEKLENNKQLENE